MFNSVSRSVRLLALGGVALAALAAQPALAATTSANLGVSATVTSNCAISTSPVAFGNVDVSAGAAVNGAGSISVTCTSGTAWSAAADAGAGTGATLLTTRRMTSGLNLLDYGLYTDSGRTSVWGNGTAGVTIADTGTGSAQSKTIYGKVAAAQSTVPAGSYVDTVAVTVTY